LKGQFSLAVSLTFYSMALKEQMESYKTERLFDNSLFGICISEVYFVGINYFNEAIKHGSFEYELSKDAIDQGDYAKQVFVQEQSCTIFGWRLNVKLTLRRCTYRPVSVG